jgi:two-component system, cell cycle sensor histidine kinase and response regulator CckA
MAAGMVKSLGMDAVLFATGEGALQFYCERHEEIGAVLLDSTMPGMSARELVQLMSSINSEIPMILMSGYSEPDDRPRFDEGVIGFLQKPIELNVLRDCLRIAAESRGR